MENQRGLVISPPIEVSRGILRIKQASLDPQELRFALLFWDRLEYPSSKSIHIGSGPEADFLESEKILQRTPWLSTRSGVIGPAQFLEAHLGVFRFLDETEPGAWSIATGERSILFDDADLVTGRGALVRLHRAIPVPDKDVPLEDILEFRARRQAELRALRYYLEAIYQRILTAGDGALAMKSAIEALEAAVEDEIRVSKESQLKFRLTSVEINLNLLPMLSAASALEAGLPKVATLLGIASAAISIGPGVALSRAKPSGTPFRYVSAYHRELF